MSSKQFESACSGGSAVDYITPHTYIVTEISYFEWVSAFVLYQQKGGHS